MAELTAIAGQKAVVTRAKKSIAAFKLREGMAEIKVKLVRSRIGTTPAQRRLLDSLGLKRREMVKTFKDIPAIRGIIAKVPHMVAVVE